MIDYMAGGRAPRSMTYWTTREVAVLREQVMLGTPKKTIAGLLGKSLSAVCSACARHGARRYHMVDRAEVLRLAALGWPDCRIADRLGCTEKTAARHRVAGGVRRSPQTRYTMVQYAGTTPQNVLNKVKYGNRLGHKTRLPGGVR